MCGNGGNQYFCCPHRARMSENASETTALLEEFNWEDDEAMKEIVSLTADEIETRTRALENEIRYFDGEIRRLRLDIRSEDARSKDNNEKVKLNKQLPWLVGHIVEVGSSSPTLPLPLSLIVFRSWTTLKTLLSKMALRPSQMTRTLARRS